SPQGRVGGGAVFQTAAPKPPTPCELRLSDDVLSISWPIFGLASSLLPCDRKGTGKMARIIGGIATSHSPTIGFALDRHKQDDPVWAPIFEAYQPVRQWLARKKPDVLFLIYNDHVTSFFFDHYSHFALGIGESYAVADEGGGPRTLPPVNGHPGLAQHIAFG